MPWLPLSGGFCIAQEPASTGPAAGGKPPVSAHTPVAGQGEHEPAGNATAPPAWHITGASAAAPRTRGHKPPATAEAVLGYGGIDHQPARLFMADDQRRRRSVPERVASSSGT